MSLAMILLAALSTLAQAQPLPLFQILNNPYAKRPEVWVKYQLDLSPDASGDLQSAHYYGGRENGTFTIDEVKSPAGAVLMRSRGVDAIKLLGPALSAKDGGAVTLTYARLLQEPGQFEMKLAREGSGWSAIEAATGKTIQKLRIKTQFCGLIGECGVESVTAE